MKTQTSPAKAASARINGRKGGTKSPHISRWNSLKHAGTAGRLSIIEGRHLPESGEFVSMRDQLIEELARLGPLTLEDLVAIDKAIVDIWRWRRAFRHELLETEQAGAMGRPSVPTVLRYIHLADRQLTASLARIAAIRERLMAEREPSAQPGGEEVPAPDAVLEDEPTTVEDQPTLVATPTIDQAETAFATADPHGGDSNLGTTAGAATQQTNDLPGEGDDSV